MSMEKNEEQLGFPRCPEGGNRLYYRKTVDAWVCRMRLCQNYWVDGSSMYGATFDKNGDVKKACINCMGQGLIELKLIKNKYLKMHKCHTTGSFRFHPNFVSCEEFTPKFVW